MSALTVTLGADITALKRAMAGAMELVSASAKRMGKMTSAGLSGIGKGGGAVLSKGFGLAVTGIKAGIGAALAGGAVAMGVGVKSVMKAADFEQTKVALPSLTLATTILASLMRSRSKSSMEPSAEIGTNPFPIAGYGDGPLKSRTSRWMRRRGTS